ncbi:MAG: hypothetical protein IJ987_01440, partial [Firmicutes bacterium]|nr:hypothetical protein [Bacillota bacterium]
ACKDFLTREKSNDGVHSYTDGKCGACGQIEYNVGIFEKGLLVTGHESLVETLVNLKSGQYIKLFADVVGSAQLDSDLYIDLNGYDLSGTITTNGFQIYGMDSTTDGYVCDSVGCFNCVDEKGDTIVPVRQFSTDLPGLLRRYMAIEGKNGYSFHRFYLGITHMTVKPSVNGVGYKGVLCGDEMVAGELASYGYSLWFDGYRKATVTKSADSFASGKTVTLRINKFDVQNFSEKELHAAVVMTLKDGTVIESADYTMTLRSLVETINKMASTLTATQIQALADMIKANPVMQSWDVENLCNK